MGAAIDSRPARATPLASCLRALRSVRPHEYLLLAVLLFVTDRYRWMMDDAFIYFRYADNLLFLGRGLVYNPGEFCEGYSSPLWMLLILPLRALSLDFYTLVRALALVCAAGYGAALIWLNRRLSPGRPVVNFPLAASAAHYGITTHFSSGLETPLVQLLAPLYAAALLRPQSLWLQLAIALSPLVRAECALLCGAFALATLLRTRRVPFRFIALTAALNLGWLAFRVVYYADLLPNTFYLKDGTNWRQGLYYWKNVSATHHWPLAIGLVSACAWLGRARLRGSWSVRGAMLLPAVLYGVYVARIGGDMLYHRYAALPVCLGLCASAGVLEAALAALSARFAPSLTSSRPALVGGLELGLAAAIAVLYGVAHPPQLREHPWHAPTRSKKWHAIADPNWHRRHQHLAYTERRADEDARQRELYARWRGSPDADRGAKLIVQGFCQLAYRRFDTIVVHDFGLTDPVLSRLPRPFGRPGHKYVQQEAAELAALRQRAAQTAPPVAWYERKDAPPWVRANRPALAVLERKLRNRHAPLENLELALTRVALE